MEINTDMSRKNWRRRRKKRRKTKKKRRRNRIILSLIKFNIPYLINIVIKIYFLKIILLIIIILIINL